MFISATINELTREIKWDKSQVAAVDGDYAVNGFKLTCLELDPDYNLTTGTWYAVFTAQDGTSHSNPLTVSGGVVTWEFDNNINKGGSGVIKFFLYAVTTNAAGKVLKRWDSAITDLRVAGTIDYENQEEEAARESEIDRLAGLVTTLTATAATINDVKAVLARITNSSPVVVATAADLSGLDTTKYQLAIVRADGYLYYYDGSEWQQGIKYGSYELDATLTESGKAADAAAVGAEVSAIKEDLSSIQGLTPDIKTALLNCFENVAWKGSDPSGQSYIDALSAALNPPANLVSISAVYTQSGTVYDTATLESLRSDLVVTAHYSDSTTATITDYILSGSLVVGTNTITVAYGGKTATFTVVVTSSLLFSLRNQEFTSESEGINTGINLFSVDSDWTIACDLSVPVAIGRNIRIFSSMQPASPYNGFMYGYEQNIPKVKWVTRTANEADTSFGPSFTGTHKCIFVHTAGGGLNCYFKDNDNETTTLALTTKWQTFETQNLTVSSSSETLKFIGTINRLDVYARAFDASEINAFMGVA